MRCAFLLTVGRGWGLWAHWPWWGRRAGWGSVWVGPGGLLQSCLGSREAGAFCLEPGSAADQNQLETSLERREGGFVSSKDTSKGKLHAGRSKYACLEETACIYEVFGLESRVANDCIRATVRSH